MAEKNADGAEPPNVKIEIDTPNAERLHSALPSSAPELMMNPKVDEVAGVEGMEGSKLRASFSSDREELMNAEQSAKRPVKQSSPGTSESQDTGVVFDGPAFVSLDDLDGSADEVSPGAAARTDAASPQCAGTLVPSITKYGGTPVPKFLPPIEHTKAGGSGLTPGEGMKKNRGNVNPGGGVKKVGIAISP
jgi:hypothetical protein